MDNESLSWNDFEGALRDYRDKFYHGKPAEERMYLSACRILASRPIREKAERVDALVLWLNQWHCRLSREQAPMAFANWIERNASSLEQLEHLSITDPQVPEYAEAIQRLYDSLIDLKRGSHPGIHNMSDAAASKVLHMMIPGLFVMWDANIKRRPYGDFIVKMHNLAIRLRDELAPEEAREDIEEYLQVTLGYPVRKTLAKHIDEFLWYLAFGYSCQTNGAAPPPAPEGRDSRPSSAMWSVESDSGVHYFTSQKELDSFFRRGQGYVLNHYKNCLHRVACDHYRYNRPGLNYTKTGYDTAADVIDNLGVPDSGWYACQKCRPELEMPATV